jgi:2-methylisocitrate lyase-like PEP mutase family enzyme
MITTQIERGAALLGMHGPGRILVLPNVWDAVSARLFERAGFGALATTSAGVAFTLGYPDGERISRAEMVAAVRRIASRVAVPVTADMEAGYGPRPEDVGETVRETIAAGAVGMNLEDGDPTGNGLFELERQVERVRAAREAAETTGVPFTLNARTDVFLARVGEAGGRLGHAVRRLNAYREAGASCLFAPGVTDAATIAALVRELSGPLNVLAVRGTPTIAELKRLGVRRVSVGSGPMRAGLGLVRRIADELRGAGTFTLMTDDAIPHDEVNRLLEDGG